MNHCTLLLIESDPLLYMLLHDIFSTAGYHVLRRAHDDPIHQVDTMVPDIAVISGGARGTFATGWQTAQRLRQVFPSLPLIMISTNSSAVEEVGRTERGRLFVAGIQKPFIVNELLATVARWRPDRRQRRLPAVLIPSNHDA